MVAQERANTKVAASSIRRWTIALKNACNNAANFLHALITIPNGNHTPRYSYSRLLRKKRYDRLGGIKGRKKGVLLARDNIIDRLVRERKRGGGEEEEGRKKGREKNWHVNDEENGSFGGRKRRWWRLRRAEGK